MLDGSPSEVRKVLKLVPASDPDANSGEMPARAAVKSVNRTPTFAATPPACAAAPWKSTKSSFDWFTAPVI